MTDSLPSSPISRASTIVLLVDDHALFAQGFSLLLADLDDRVQIESTQSCEQALTKLADGLIPDLILFDLGLPGLSDLEAFRCLQKAAPGVPIVAVSADERSRVVTELMRAGARGYIPKSTTGEVTLSALRLVLAGGTYVPEIVLGAMPAAVSLLTPRELAVLELLANGQGNKEMAVSLDMAESTVRVHVTSILRRLGVSSRFEAVTSPLARELLLKATNKVQRKP